MGVFRATFSTYLAGHASYAETETITFQTFLLEHNVSSYIKPGQPEEITLPKSFQCSTLPCLDMSVFYSLRNEIIAENAELMGQGQFLTGMKKLL